MNKSITLLVGALAAVFFASLWSASASASGISIAPLEYKASLQRGEFKKGYVDVVNPNASNLPVRLDVQAFRQVNDQGGLAFYSDPTITRGIKLDIDSVELGPGEGVRVYFRLDAAKLPSGDVFAAILASSVVSNKSVQTIPSARVGTLLMIENGTPPPHHAVVQDLDANWLQIDDAMTARMLIKNTDPASGSALGFMPKLEVSLWPYGTKTIDGPLIFSGRSREVGYRQVGSYFGPVLIRATIDGNSVSRLVFAVTGYWRWLAPLMLVVLVAIIVVFRMFAISSKKHNIKTFKRP